MSPAPRKPPKGPPRSAGELAKYVQAYARDNEVAEGRVRSWIAYMVVAGILERGTADGYRFTLKGGVALELRLRERARATKDLDLVMHGPTEDLKTEHLALALERSIAAGQ